MMMICLCVLWIVFLIILLCTWSIKSHCTNSYCEIQLSLYFRNRGSFTSCLYDHSNLAIELCVLSYVIQFLWIILQLWLTYQPISSIMFWFSHRYYILPAYFIYKCVICTKQFWFHTTLVYCKLCDSFNSFDFIPV